MRYRSAKCFCSSKVAALSKPSRPVAKRAPPLCRMMAGILGSNAYARSGLEGGGDETALLLSLRKELETAGVDKSKLDKLSSISKRQFSESVVEGLLYKGTKECTDIGVFNPGACLVSVIPPALMGLVGSATSAVGLVPPGASLAWLCGFVRHCWYCYASCTGRVGRWAAAPGLGASPQPSA